LKIKEKKQMISEALRIHGENQTRAAMEMGNLQNHPLAKENHVPAVIKKRRVRP